MKKGIKNPKEKGSRKEREVSVELSKWASLGEREDLFWRSATSGGRATVAKKKGKDLQTQAGDFSAIHPMGQPLLDVFYIENKAYNDLKYEGILTGTGHLVNFWNDTVTKASLYKRQPMLIAKQDYKPTVVFLQIRGCETLALSQGQCVIVAPRLGAYGFLFDDFVRWARPL